MSQGPQQLNRHITPGALCVTMCGKGSLTTLPRHPTADQSAEIKERQRAHCEVPPPKGAPCGCTPSHPSNRARELCGPHLLLEACPLGRATPKPFARVEARERYTSLVGPEQAALGVFGTGRPEEPVAQHMRLRKAAASVTPGWVSCTPSRQEVPLVVPRWDL